ncbi:MAG: DUF2029 domain-containing protein, partial [Chloroflexi bacterium]|nr:DUF2029 domain-containing protein [Chloroflexota bacterium]
MKIRAGSAMELTMLRLGLVCAGALLLRLGFAVALTAPLSQSPADVGILIAVGFAGLLLLTTAARPQPPFSLRWLILAACIAELAVRSLVWAQTAHLPDRVMTDAALYSDFAGQLIRRGQNPYAWDLSGAFDLYRTTQALSTPILNGAITSNYPYPALAFLLVVPFQALGLPGSFALLLLAQAATLVLLFAASPKSAQPLILIPIVAGFDFTTLTYIGSQDFIWSALLVGMILTWHRPRLRAIFFGLAASVKQAPWLVLPFLIIRLWRDESGESPIRRVSYFSVVSAATFLTINGPFILWDAAAWFRGVAEPLSGNLV